MGHSTLAPCVLPMFPFLPLCSFYVPTSNYTNKQIIHPYLSFALLFYILCFQEHSLKNVKKLYIQNIMVKCYQEDLHS